MKDRETICEYYVCKNECSKGRVADFRGYCQRCDKYKPRSHERHINRKKQKQYKEKIDEKDE